MSFKRLATELLVCLAIFFAAIANAADTGECPQPARSSALFEAKEGGLPIALLARTRGGVIEWVTLIGISSSISAEEARLAGQVIASTLTHQPNCLIGAECKNLRIALTFVNAQMGIFRTDSFAPSDIEGSILSFSPRIIKTVDSSLVFLAKGLMGTSLGMTTTNYFWPSSVDTPVMDFLKPGHFESCYSEETCSRYVRRDTFDRGCIRDVLQSHEQQYSEQASEEPNYASYFVPVSFFASCGAILTLSAEKALRYLYPSAATSMADDLAHSIVDLLQANKESEVAALVTKGEFDSVKRILINQGFMEEDFDRAPSTVTPSI